MIIRIIISDFCLYRYILLPHLIIFGIFFSNENFLKFINLKKKSEKKIFMKINTFFIFFLSLIQFWSEMRTFFMIMFKSLKGLEYVRILIKIFYEWKSFIIKDLVERALIEIFNGGPIFEPGTYLHQSPYPCFIFDEYDYFFIF